MYETSTSPDDIVDLQMGEDHACVLSRQGFVKCWGNNDAGQLGYGNQINYITPFNGEMAYGDKHPMLYFGQNRTVTQIDVGYERSCALLDDGSIACWGRYSQYMFTSATGSSSGSQYTPLSLTQYGTDNLKVVIGELVQYVPSRNLERCSVLVRGTLWEYKLAMTTPQPRLYQRTLLKERL